MASRRTQASASSFADLSADVKPEIINTKQYITFKIITKNSNFLPIIEIGKMMIST
jgi:hypothetical protein